MNGASFSADLSLGKRVESIREHYAASGAGLSVLDTAVRAVNEGSYKLVGIEDLWATALKEGRTLFPKPTLWGATTAEQTGDMLGQTTVGPWQITLQNAREYGAAYGLQSEWSDRQVVSYLESNRVIQARIAADFIEVSYQMFGKRNPLGIQRYFWLDGFLQRKIGQGAWYNRVLAKSPEEMITTGFYAKQLLLGSRYNPQGLLYWLYISGDRTAVIDALDAWKKSGYPIVVEDLDHCSCDSRFRSWLSSVISASS